MSRFHGGVLSDEEKEEWLKQAKEEGFDNLWEYIKWVIRNRIKKAKKENK